MEAGAQENSRAVVADLEPLLREKLGLISQKTKLAEAIHDTLSRWEGLSRFLDDAASRSTATWSNTQSALNRKVALVAGSDGGAEHWAVIASLIETCKLYDGEPLGYLANVLARIVTAIPTARSTTLLPWACIRLWSLRPDNSTYDLIARRPRIIDLLIEVG